MKKLKIGFFIRKIDNDMQNIKDLSNLIKESAFEYEIELFVFHISKLLNYNILDEIKKYKQFSLVDLSYKNLDYTIKQTQINNMIFINSQHVVDMLLIQYCNENNIRTVHFQHGLKINWESNKNVLFNQKHKSLMVLKGMAKYFRFLYFVIYNMWSLKCKKNLICAYNEKIKLLLNKGFMALSQQYGIASHRCKRALVYSEYDKEQYILNYGYSSEEICVMGYPIIQSTKNEIEWQNYSLYLSSALRIASVIPVSKLEELDFYQQLVDEFQKYKRRLIIKIHPLETLKYFDAVHYDKEYVKIVKDTALDELVKKCNVVIGDYTTALYYAIYFYKPILILRCKSLDPYPFDYTSFGIGKRVWLDELSILLQNNYKNIDSYILKNNYKEFCDKYILPKDIVSVLTAFNLFESN